MKGFVQVETPLAGLSPGGIQGANRPQGADREAYAPPFVSSGLTSSLHISALQSLTEHPWRHFRRPIPQAVQMTVIWTLRPNG